MTNPENRRPPVAEEIQHLFYLIGKATWFIQYLEHALHASIVMKVYLKNKALGAVTMTRLNAALAKHRRDT
jgi:hypothetical protein